MNQERDKTHPKLSDIQSFGLQNESQEKMVFSVYLDLCEVKGWWDVKIHHCEALQVVFLSGHPKRHSPQELVLPLCSSSKLSPELIQQYLQALQLEDCKTSGITLAISDNDSATVYYKVTDGLVAPDSPEQTEHKKQQRGQKFQKRRLNISRQVNDYKQIKQQKLLSENDGASCHPADNYARTSGDEELNGVETEDSSVGTENNLLAESSTTICSDSVLYESSVLCTEKL